MAEQTSTFKDLSASQQRQLRAEGFSNLPLEFNEEHPITGHAGAQLLSNFYIASGMGELLEKHIDMEYHGINYTKEALIHQVVQIYATGLGCFERASEMAHDPAFRLARGAESDSCPQNLRYFISRLAKEDQALKLGNCVRDYGVSQIPSEQTEYEFVLDMSRLQSYGHQEGVKAGRLGDGRIRKCHSFLIGAERHSQQVLTAEYYKGGTDPKPHLAEQLTKLRQAACDLTGQAEALIRIRLDGGFFIWDNVDFLNLLPPIDKDSQDLLEVIEGQRNILYVMKIDSQKGSLELAHSLDYTPSKFKERQDAGEKLSRKETSKIKFEYSEFRYKSTNRNKNDRIVVRRRAVEEAKAGQLKLPTFGEDQCYNYEFLVTNSTEPPEDIWLWYDDGGFIEQIIENGKNGCAWECLDGHGYEENRICFLLKVLALDLNRAFQRKALADTPASHWEISTLIRRIIRIPALLCRRGKGWILRASNEHPLAQMLQQAQSRIVKLAIVLMAASNPRSKIGVVPNA
jgi:hypothetical protein